MWYFVQVYFSLLTGVWVVFVAFDFWYELWALKFYVNSEKDKILKWVSKFLLRDNLTVKSKPSARVKKKLFLDT